MSFVGFANEFQSIIDCFEHSQIIQHFEMFEKQFRSPPNENRFVDGILTKLSWRDKIYEIAKHIDEKRAIRCFSALPRGHRPIFEFEFDFDDQCEELIFGFVIPSLFFKASALHHSRQTFREMLTMD
jgi:hypothetical protein